MSDERLRLFVALELPEAVGEELVEWSQAALADRFGGLARPGPRPGSGLRVLDPDSMHITLCFLDSKPEREVGPIGDACAEAVVGARALELSLGQAVWLPPRRPGVLAVELEDPAGALADIQARCSAALQAGGWYEPEDRPYFPHVTVARVRKGWSVRGHEMVAPPTVGFEGSRVTLFRSVSSRGGSTYEPLRIVELARETVAVDEPAAPVVSPDAALASFTPPQASPVAAPVLDSLAEATDPLLVVVRFHDAQRRAYAGGPIDSLRSLLSDDVVWHVPGRSLIAGEHRGIDAVLAYFEQRRAITGATLRVIVHGTAMVGDRVVQLAGGRAEREGRELTWETVGVFRVAAGRIAECWLVPFDQYAFDRIWGEAPPGD